MSPPKVTLATKTPEDEPAEPAVSETEVKPDKLDMPPVALVTVETERSGQLQALRTRRRQSYRRLACGIMMVTIVAIAALGTITLVHRIKHKHRRGWDCRYGKNKLPEHVKVDHENQLIYARHDHDNQGHTPALHVLHEYDRRLVAYKDEDQNICYIDRLDETFHDGYARWVSYEHHGHQEGKMLARISEKPIETEVLRHIGDIHIFAHCESATSYWFMEIHEHVEKDTVVVHV